MTIGQVVFWLCVCCRRKLLGSIYTRNVWRRRSLQV